MKYYLGARKSTPGLKPITRNSLLHAEKPSSTKHTAILGLLTCCSMFVERSSTILIIIISKFRDGALATAHLCQNSEKTFSEKNSLLPYFPILWAKILGLYAQDTPLSQKNISIRRFGKITVGKSGRRTHHKICFFGRLLASKYIFTYRKILFSWYLKKTNLSTGLLQDEHPTRVFLSFYETELLHVDRPDFTKTWIKNIFFSLEY